MRFFPVPLVGWGALGCYRGMKEYQYSVQKYELPYMYMTHGLFGMAGTLCYMNPFLLGLIVPKEVYRMDMLLRGLENEKESDKYNEVI